MKKCDSKETFHANVSGLLEKLFNESETNSSKVICSDLVSDIVTNKRTFLELVEALESPLTNPDLNKHIVGLDVLASVLELLPQELLSEKELEFIAQFFCGQVKQHHSFISAALRALVALVKNVQLPRHSLHDVMSTLFSSVVWQTQTLADRRVFYTILQYLIFNRLDDYKSISSELLFNVISSVDGERDPRNLLLLFSFLPKLYTSIPLGPLTEDAFEVVSCYFPIDFHSSASEAGTVSREDLVSALTPCLLAVSQFAEFCIPLIQEKLDSTLKSAKIDSYNLLTEAVKVWPADCIVPYCEQLWLVVKRDVLPPRDHQTADTAIHALQAVITTVTEPSLSSMLTSIMHSCEGFLSDVQLSLFEPSSRLLLSVMSTTLPACHIVSHKFLPKLISLLHVTQDTSRIIVLHKLTSAIQVCLLMNPEYDFEVDWKQLADELILCAEQGSADLQQAAYCALTLTVKYLDADCRAKLYSCLLPSLQSLQPTLLRSSSIKCLQALAVTQQDEVQTKIVENLNTLQGEKDLDLIRNSFETVCSLAVVERFHPLVEQQFVSLVSREENYKSAAISCLRNLLEEEVMQSNISLINFLFSKSSILDTLINTSSDSDDLTNSAAIIHTLVGLQSPSEQTRVVPRFVRDLLQHPNQNQQMVLLESFVGSLWPEVTILTAEEVSRVVIPVALHSYQTAVSHTAALQLLSSLINKSTDDNLLEEVSQKLDPCTPEQVAVTYSYVTKALVLRSHPAMELWLNKLMDLLGSEEVGQLAADGIQMVMEDSGKFLNQQNHCNVKLLYRQRLFYLVLPRIVQSSRKIQHLKALAYVIQAVPHTVYVHHVKQIMPLLVTSLDVDCDTLVLTVLHTLTNLLSTSDTVFQDHLDTFIPRFLHLSRHCLSMQVRIAALKCLSSTLKYSPILLLPLKQRVLTELVPCLDDKKRLVRKEAARTRSRWFLLGAPTADS